MKLLKKQMGGTTRKIKKSPNLPNNPEKSQDDLSPYITPPTDRNDPNYYDWAYGGTVTNQGYLKDSPDRFNSYNIIPGGNITMKGVPHKVLGTDDKGNQQLMHPGAEYTFPDANYVKEVPFKKNGGMTRDKADHILAYQNYFSDSQIKRANKYRLDSVDKHVSVAQMGGTGIMMRDNEDYKYGGIHIKKSHEGKFTAYKKRTGQTTEEATHSSDPHVRKMAVFAQNAKHWKHQMGGDQIDPGKTPFNLPSITTGDLPNQSVNNNHEIGNYQNGFQKFMTKLGDNPYGLNDVANLGDQINQGVKDRYDNQYLRDRTTSDNLFAIVPGSESGKRGDYSTTGSSYGAFRPDELGTKSPYGTTGKFYQTGGGYIPDAIQESPQFNGSQQGPNSLGDVPDSIPYTAPVGPSAGTAPPVENKEVDLNDSSKFAYNYYTKEKGLPGHIAAGIVGNLYQESGLKPGAVEQDHTGNGRGIAQWDVRDRWQGYLNWAKENQRNPYDLKSQLDYVLVEPGQSKQALDKLKNTTTPEQAAVIFGKIYERPNEKYANWGVRQKVASELDDQYKEGGVYEINPDQLFHILQSGGEVDFV